MIIDCSHHNGQINYKEVALNVPIVNGVFLKATQGTGYTDSRLRQNAKGFSDAGIPLSYYHYATLNTREVIKDATEEANYFCSVIRTLPHATLPIVLDIEENKANLSTSEVLGWIKTFFGQLTINGCPEHLLYSYTPFLNANLPQDHGLGNIPLWIAAYVNLPSPRLPIGWTSYHLWQYSAKGRISGINGDVDLNKYPA